MIKEKATERVRLFPSTHRKIKRRIATKKGETIASYVDKAVNQLKSQA